MTKAKHISMALGFLRVLLAAGVGCAVLGLGGLRLVAEDEAGFKPLFDGKTFNGWRGYGKSAMPDKGWRIQDGMILKVKGERGGDIITERKFEDFDVRWEWRISRNGNNGLKYLVTEARAKGPGHEYQMIDDAGNFDGALGLKHQTAAFYDVLPPKKDRKLHAPGEWNSSRVLLQGTHVEHWLNGEKVLEYELESEAVKIAVAASKFKDAKGFGERGPGHILLTDHGDECWFRNLRLRELPKKLPEKLRGI